MKSISKKKITTIAIVFCFVFLLSLTVLSFIKSRKLTDSDSIVLHNYSNSLVNYFENFEDIEGQELSLYQKQLAFSLDYFYYEESKETVPLEDFSAFLKDNFNTELNMETLGEDLMNPALVSKSAIYNTDEETIQITPPSPTKRERAKIPITKYLETTIKKKGNTFKVTYEKYVIESAYDALNCLSRQENPEEQEEGEQLDIEDAPKSNNTAKMMSYLNAKSTIKNAQDALTPECTKELSEVKSSMTVTYKMQDSKIFIEKIEY